MPKSQVDVAIIGGGPVGLTAANLLGQLGISCALFERQRTTSFHPRGHVVDARVMEILRTLGLEEAVNAASLPVERHAGIGFVVSLAGEEIGHIRTRGDHGPDERETAISPVLKRSCPQDMLEPVLLSGARRYASLELNYETEVTAISQASQGVEISWQQPDGAKGVTTAKYLIGADGSRSFTRDAVGIEMTGGSMGQQIGVYFHADLWKYVEDRPYLLWWIYNSATTGVLISLDGRQRWTYNFPYPEGEDRAAYTVDRCREIVLAAIGAPDIPVEIKSVMPWRMQARVANKLQVGRVFIAGDAAHPLPPTGGQGMNTGIADVHNLVWKISLVLRGYAPESLLESYEGERLPVATFNVQQSARNAKKMADAGLSGILALDPEVSSIIDKPEGYEVRQRLAAAIPAQRAHFDYPGQTFGYAYSSCLVVPDGSPEVPFDVETYTPSARPGQRAPHAWFSRSGERVSTIDLFSYDAFTLVCADASSSWIDPFRDVCERLGVKGNIVAPGHDDLVAEDPKWIELYGIGREGAVLVRPDGHVAWRSASAGETAGIRAALLSAVGHADGSFVDHERKCANVH